MKPARIILVVAIALVAGAAWLLHWSRNAVRPVAVATADKNSLRQIGLACREYAEQHQGHYPTDWASLTNELDSGAKIFVCWHERARVGAMSNVMAWTSYGYVPGATTASPPDAVVAYLRPRRYGKHAGGLILFVDGNVSWESVADFDRVLNEPVTNGMARPRHPLPGGGGYD